MIVPTSIDGAPGRRFARARARWLRGAVAAVCLLMPGTALAVESTGPVPPVAGPASLLAGYFRLQDPSGRVVDADAIAGKPYGLFFGFTHCPDICPTTLAQVSLALGPIRDPDLRLYFITVDPERDTPAVMARYMESFDPRIVALTGGRPEIEAAQAGFGIVAQRAAVEGGYVYGHSASLILVDENGIVFDRSAVSADIDALRARIAKIAAQPASTAGARP